MSLISRVMLVSIIMCVGFFRTGTLQAKEKNHDAANGDSTFVKINESHTLSDTLAVDHDPEYLPTWYDMITRIPGDWVEYSKETFQGKNIPAFLGISAATAALVVVDRQWYWTEKDWYDESSTFRTFSNWMVFTGDGRFQFGLVGAFAAYGFVFSDARSLRTASETTEAILACGGIVQLLKHVTGRQSPFCSTKRTGKWDFFPNQIQYAKHTPAYDAFPSGHLATATTTLIVIADNYPEITWLKPIGYVALGAISSSLVAYGIHWWSDFPLAFVLGYSFGEIAAHPLGVTLGAKNIDESPKLSFSPVLLPNGAGLGVSFSF